MRLLAHVSELHKSSLLNDTVNEGTRENLYIYGPLSLRRDNLIMSISSNETHSAVPGPRQLLWSPLNVDEAINQAYAAACVDPRDKVYGMLALLDLSLQWSITPQYDVPVFTVYLEFCQSDY